ncbi:hypothetical protein RN001_002209 [Aquatica leii]|uniref:Gag protein n=1 Tax=Aquatica leii TaxID=1421715 RepID=A0AAN7PH03_9COLE|nr:hypothetical protein RN001_002209 [Aquatica leii]
MDSTASILDKWPFYKTAYEFRLIDMDFDALYTIGDGLLSKWENKRVHILQFLTSENNVKGVLDYTQKHEVDESNRPEIRSWVDLKSLLRLSFGDQRNLDCLFQDLLITRPLRNESYLSFGQRIQKCKSAIASKLLRESLSNEERTFQMINYDQLALKTFIRGLQGRVQDMTRLRNPDTFELALSYVLEEENFMLYQKQSHAIQNTMFNPNNQKNYHKIQNNNFRPTNYQNIQPSHFNSQYNAHESFNSQFPSQPIQPKPNLPTKRFFSNQEVFGKPKDVFKPSYNYTPQNKTEPMSTSTHISKFQQPMSISTRNTNFSKPLKNNLYNLEQNECTSENQSDNNTAGPSRASNYDFSNRKFYEQPEQTNSNENFYEVTTETAIT